MSTDRVWAACANPACRPCRNLGLACFRITKSCIHAAWAKTLALPLKSPGTAKSGNGQTGARRALDKSWVARSRTRRAGHTFRWGTTTALYRAPSCTAAILIADEPTGGLDAEYAARPSGNCSALSIKLGVTIVVSPTPREMKAFGCRIVALDSGRVMA